MEDQNQPTEGVEEKIKVGDRELTLKELNEALEAFNNKKAWQAENTRKSQELAEYRKQLEQWAKDEWARLQTASQQLKSSKPESGLEESVEDIDDVIPGGSKILKPILEKLNALERASKQHNEWIHTLASYGSTQAKTAAIEKIMASHEINSPTLKNILGKAYDAGATHEELSALADEYAKDVKANMRVYAEKKKAQGEKPPLVTSKIGGSAPTSPGFVEKFKNPKDALKWLKSGDANKTLKEFIANYKKD